MKTKPTHTPLCDESNCPIAAAVTRWSRRKEARPGEILEAAMSLFVEKGFAATRMDEIARRAGVTAGTLYRYFPGKEDMLKAVINESIVACIEHGEKHLAQQTGSAATLLEGVIRAWWAQVSNTPASGISKLMLSEAGNFPELARYYREEVIERGERLIARAIESGIASGEFRRQPVDIAVKVVIAPVVMATLWKTAPTVCNNSALDFDQYLDAVVNTLLHGLSAKATPAQDVEPARADVDVDLDIDASTHANAEPPKHKR